MTAYYDGIARRWHAATGARGGAVKEHLLNDAVLTRIAGVAGTRVLELGAGNGYFLPLVLRRFSGQVPARIVVTDQSRVLIDIARQAFPVAGAEYLALDVRDRFPFPGGSFDLILANMVFNEVPAAGLGRALAECRRTLAPGGRMLATLTHPAFVGSLARRGELRPWRGGVFTMPGAGGLRLPVVPRGEGAYTAAVERAGFRLRAEAITPTARVLSAKPGLRRAGRVPVAWVWEAD